MVEKAFQRGVCYFDPLNNSVVHVLQLASGAGFGVAQNPGTQVIKTILYDTKWSGVVNKRFRAGMYPCR